MTLPGQLLVLSAPSGTGKTTLARRLVAQEPDALFSISATTRPARPGERPGIDYSFLTSEAFAGMIEAGELLEWAEVHGNRYGTPGRYADEAARGKLVVFDIDVQGGLAIKRRHPQAATVFVFPPSIDELERRLRARRTDDDLEVARRLLAARAEMRAGAESYDWMVVNDDLDRALGDLLAIARTLRGTAGRAERERAEACRKGSPTGPALPVT